MSQWYHSHVEPRSEHSSSIVSPLPPSLPAPAPLLLFPRRAAREQHADVTAGDDDDDEMVGPSIPGDIGADDLIGPEPPKPKRRKVCTVDDTTCVCGCKLQACKCGCSALRAP